MSSNNNFIHAFAGEVERLLKEYRQNQELVRRIGGHYYQIIYPVQLRHHEKMGISTREVSPPKVRKDLHKRNTRKIETDTMVCSLLFSLIRAIVCPIICTQTRSHTHTHLHLHKFTQFIRVQSVTKHPTLNGRKFSLKKFLIL